MKFETKFGLGEIVYYTRSNHPNAQHDMFLEVVAISFDKNGVMYHCRYPMGQMTTFPECDLIGDPEFDQEAGRYNYELNGDE